MLQVVPFLGDLWAEFITPSSGNKWKFNPTYFSQLTYSFWRDYSEIFTIFFSTSFLSVSCGNTFKLLPSLGIHHSRNGIQSEYQVLTPFLPNGKRKTLRLGKICCCRCLLHLTIWALYVVSGKFLEDKDYLILYLCPSPSVLHKNFPVIYAQLLFTE